MTNDREEPDLQTTIANAFRLPKRFLFNKDAHNDERYRSKIEQALSLCPEKQKQFLIELFDFEWLKNGDNK